MIKRRYFRQDHGDKSSSSSSSSGSDSDHDPAAEAVTDEEQEDHGVAEEKSGEEQQEGLEQQQFDKESSGYQGEDSSRNDVDGPSIDDDNRSPMYEEDNEMRLPIKKAPGDDADPVKGDAKKDDAIEVDFTNYILKCKSVYKCKLCPRIMCLNEQTVRVHLKSKRHARSKKLLEEGRLKLMLNSDDELEEELETHAERHARTVALAQQVQKAKKDSGRQRQNRRRKKRSHNHEKKQETQNSDKKRRKIEK